MLLNGFISLSAVPDTGTNRLLRAALLATTLHVRASTILTAVWVDT
jgi:hypothetical protein